MTRFVSNSLAKGPPAEVELPAKRYGPRPTLSAKQNEELHIAFGEFDPRGTGMIDARSYIIALRAMGFEPNVESVQGFIDETIGACGRESLDYKEFYKLMAIKMLGDDRRAEQYKMFKSFTNDDASGVITLENLTVVAHEIGEAISRDELSEMISFANTSKNGQVTFDEFVRIMERPELE